MGIDKRRLPLDQRPRMGDTVQMTRWPHAQQRVIATFYCNGEGGMHVMDLHEGGGAHWSCCDNVEIVERGPEWAAGRMPQ